MVQNRKFRAAQKASSFILLSSALLLILESEKDGMLESEIKEELGKEFGEKITNEQQFKYLIEILQNEGYIKQVGNEKKFKLTPAGINKVEIFHQFVGGYKAATEK